LVGFVGFDDASKAVVRLRRQAPMIAIRQRQML
jgi:hypothetical protein